jgi:hypothetical protein
LKPAPPWLNPQRLALYGAVSALCYLILWVGYLSHFRHWLDPHGLPFGSDFITFWAASHLAQNGQAPAAYQQAAILAAEQLAVPGLKLTFRWFYPPTFYLLVLPLASLPYAVAYAGFLGSTLLAFIAAFRRVASSRTALCCLAGFAGLWLNAVHGQNGFLTAALAAAGLLCLPGRPLLAGLCIGLLAIKPHLALLFPLALVAIGAWRTLALALLSGTLLLMVSLLVLGSDTLLAFFDGLQAARHGLEAGALPWAKMPTCFAQLRLLGVPVPVAYAAHALLAMLAVLTVWQLWRRPVAPALRNAALMCATFMVSPYVFDYDLVWLAFPLAWMALDGARHGWLRGERTILLLAWLLPAFMASLVDYLPLQSGAWLLPVLLWAIRRRALTSAAAGHQ